MQAYGILPLSFLRPLPLLISRHFLLPFSARPLLTRHTSSQLGQEGHQETHLPTSGSFCTPTEEAVGQHRLITQGAHLAK